jgi:hypothetical protein
MLQIRQIGEGLMTDPVQETTSNKEIVEESPSSYSNFPMLINNDGSEEGQTASKKGNKLLIKLISTDHENSTRELNSRRLVQQRTNSSQHGN